MKSLSIVIPAYNESNRIGGSLESILAFIKDSDRRTEVIVVDDGSGDNTVEVVESFIAVRHLDSHRRVTPGRPYAVSAGRSAIVIAC